MSPAPSAMIRRARASPSEGFQEDYVAFVKTLTSKPVVGVGRFTSPDTMVSQIRRGVLDLIGAARPSIADPFLPRKIGEGREDEIRECIGCNICRAANNEAVPLRCTQNPTMGEEWRRGWHPERMRRGSAEGSCPDRRRRTGRPRMRAGARPARAFRSCWPRRAASSAGGSGAKHRLRVSANWIRVRDHREHMLGKLPQCRNLSREPDDARGYSCHRRRIIVVATGSRWRRDGIGALQETEVADRQGCITADSGRLFRRREARRRHPRLSTTITMRWAARWPRR